MEDVKSWFEMYKFKGLKLVAFKADELIYEITDTIPKGLDEKKLEYEMKNADIRVEIFTIGRIECKNHNDIPVDCYIRKCHTTGEETLKSASQIFYPQLYKLWKNQNICEIDLAFLAEGQVAHFDYPLELVKIS
jgi:hypothetical protein